jgi:N-acyl-D-amino-acid deacylase
MAYDLVVRNGTVVDGSGLAAFRADVGIVVGRIARIGRIRERGKAEVDAEGHVVTPGFIDGHTHMDAQIHWDPLGTSSSWNGVTTAVMGNCGFTIAPSSHQQSELVMMNLERAEDIPRSAMQEGIRQWSWDTFPEYLDVLDRLPKGINYASYIGHSALRTWAMGERALEGPSSEDDLARMEAQLRAAMQAGAVGFSTSRSDNHETPAGRPVASRNASWDEVRRLVAATGEYGGLFELAKEGAANGADPVKRRESLDRLQALLVETGVVGTAGIPPGLPRDAWRDQLDMLDRTAAQGGTMIGQSHTRGTTVMTSFLTNLPFDKLPQWKAFRAQPLEQQKAQLGDPAMRARLVQEARNGDYGRAIGAEARKPDWRRMRVLLDMVMPNPKVGDLADERGLDPVELMITMALERDFNLFFIENTGACAVEPETLLQIMKHPRCVMTFSDAGAHVSQICDSSLQVQFLSYWTRERGAFTLEEAVRQVTLAPARVWGFHDRGLLREGMAADLNVIDYARLAPEYPTVSRDLPGGARRLTQKSRGIRATIVGGQVLFRDGEHTGALPGQLLRGCGARR